MTRTSHQHASSERAARRGAGLPVAAGTYVVHVRGGAISQSLLLTRE